jgi:glyoxylase-like metal-dependent hydrolase (beta-lactamase superfamily II)
MKRLLIGIFALASALFGFAQQPNVAAQAITTTQVSSNFYFIQSKQDDADVGVYVSKSGLVVVDTGYQALAAGLREAIRRISTKPIRYVLLTHYHFDHIGGAEMLAREAPIVAQENTRRRMMLPSHLGSRNDPPAPAAALPTIVFDKKLSLYVDGEEIRLLAFPAHTDGDAVIWFPRAKVVHMGDSLFGPGDDEGNGDVRGIVAACEAVTSLVPPDTKIVAGHVGVITYDELKDQGTRLRQAIEIVEAAMRQGKSLEQIKAEKLLAGVGKGDPDGLAHMIYTNLRKKAK